MGVNHGEQENFSEKTNGPSVVEQQLPNLSSVTQISHFTGNVKKVKSTAVELSLKNERSLSEVTPSRNDFEPSSFVADCDKTGTHSMDQPERHPNRILGDEIENPSSFLSQIRVKPLTTKQDIVPVLQTENFAVSQTQTFVDRVTTTGVQNEDESVRKNILKELSTMNKVCNDKPSYSCHANGEFQSSQQASARKDLMLNISVSSDSPGYDVRLSDSPRLMEAGSTFEERLKEDATSPLRSPLAEIDSPKTAFDIVLSDEASLQKRGSRESSSKRKLRSKPPSIASAIFDLEKAVTLLNSIAMETIERDLPRTHCEVDNVVSTEATSCGNMSAEILFSIPTKILHSSDATEGIDLKNTGETILPVRLKEHLPTVTSDQDREPLIETSAADVLTIEAPPERHGNIKLCEVLQTIITPTSRDHNELQFTFDLASGALVPNASTDNTIGKVAKDSLSHTDQVNILKGTSTSVADDFEEELKLFHQTIVRSDKLTSDLEFVSKTSVWKNNIEAEGKCVDAENVVMDHELKNISATGLSKVHEDGVHSRYSVLLPLHLAACESKSHEKCSGDESYTTEIKPHNELKLHTKIDERLDEIAHDHVHLCEESFSNQSQQSRENVSSQSECHVLPKAHITKVHPRSSPSPIAKLSPSMPNMSALRSLIANQGHCVTLDPVSSQLLHSKCKSNSKPSESSNSVLAGSAPHTLETEKYDIRPSERSKTILASDRLNVNNKINLELIDFKELKLDKSTSEIILNECLLNVDDDDVDRPNLHKVLRKPSSHRDSIEKLDANESDTMSCETKRHPKHVMEGHLNVKESSVESNNLDQFYVNQIEMDLNKDKIQSTGLKMESIDFPQLKPEGFKMESSDFPQLNLDLGGESETRVALDSTSSGPHALLTFTLNLLDQTVKDINDEYLKSFHTSGNVDSVKIKATDISSNSSPAISQHEGDSKQLASYPLAEMLASLQPSDLCTSQKIDCIETHNSSDINFGGTRNLYSTEPNSKQSRNSDCNRKSGHHHPHRSESDEFDFSLKSKHNHLTQELDDLDFNHKPDLSRVDSFNRPDSPMFHSTLPLPKNSIIRRHRMKGGREGRGSEGRGSGGA